MNGDVSPEGVPKDAVPPSLWGIAREEMLRGNERLGTEILLTASLNLLLQRNHQMAEKYIATSFNRMIGKLLNREPPPSGKDFVPNIIRVDLGNDRIGFKMEEDFSKLPLITLFPPETEMSEARVPTFREKIPNLIFFRTATGNIYRLGVNGELQNIRDLRNNKPPTTLDKRFLEGSILVIGEPFFYFDLQGGKVASTSKVTEIVAVNSDPYSKEAVEILTQGRTDDIMQEFNKNNPPSSSFLPNAK